MNDHKKLADECKQLVDDYALAYVERSGENDCKPIRLHAKLYDAIDALAAEPPQAVGPVVRWEHRFGKSDWFPCPEGFYNAPESGHEVRALGVIEPVREGFVLVPREPTQEMIYAGYENREGPTPFAAYRPSEVAAIYQDMVAAHHPKDTK